MPFKPVSYLLNGELMTTLERRNEALALFTSVLVREGVPANDHDAIRLLSWRGYHALDVALLAGEARRLAAYQVQQDRVATEMSQS